MSDLNGTMVEFAANGGTASGYLTKPERGEGRGVVVIQEWWGLVGHIKTVVVGSRRRAMSRSRRTCITVKRRNPRTMPESS